MADSSGIGRRAFLKGAAAQIALAGLVGATRTGLAAPALHSVSNLAALQRDMHGRLILPGDELFRFVALPRNVRWANIVPKAIARCADVADVQRCIAWAADHGEPFAVRSGGHSYAGYSTTPGLLIDVRDMNAVRFDPQDGTATVEGGANNQDVADVLRSTRFTIPSGRCPTVGVAGLTLGGGWGLTAGRFGLTCDSLLASDVAAADGRLINARPDNDAADLFWALQGGGGGNFGVAASLTLQAHEVGNVTYFNIAWPGQKQVELMLALQDIQIAHATSIATRTKMFAQGSGANPKRSQMGVATLGLYWGNEQDAREALAPALELVEPDSLLLRTADYWEARDALVADETFGVYDLRSAFVERLSAEAVETILSWMARWPGGFAPPDNMAALFAVGGKVAERSPAETDYVHRKANFIFTVECDWDPIDRSEVVKAQRRWLTAYYQAMQPFVMPEAYINFPDRDLPDWQHRYYGANLARLSAVKRKYDPHNIFRFAQSIPLN